MPNINQFQFLKCEDLLLFVIWALKINNQPEYITLSWGKLCWKIFIIFRHYVDQTMNLLFGEISGILADNDIVNCNHNKLTSFLKRNILLEALSFTHIGQLS